MKKEIVIKIMIILLSARDKFENIYLGSKLWKEKTFLNLIKEYNNNLIINIISFGDSLIELKAGKTLSSQFNNSCYKTIKFSFSGGGRIYTNNNNRIPKNYKPGYNQNKPPNSIKSICTF